MEENIKNKKLFLFDMDGTICKDNKLFDGTLELIHQIKENGCQYVFITNNSSKSLYEYINKINSFGIEVTEQNFYTSTQATIEYLRNNFFNKKVYCMGTYSLINELKNNNVNIVSTYCDDVDIVLLGFDTELNYLKIKDVCKILNKNNITYIATNPDLACPVENGFIPDCGAMAKMIEYATQKTPLFIGKPKPTMVNYIMKKLQFSRDETIVIGDRLYTDIACGINAGVSTICVLTGETTMEMINNSTIKPKYVLNSVKDLYLILKDNSYK